jgi:hypothetical protein
MLFEDNVYDIYMYRCMHTLTMISCQPTPLLPTLALSCPFHMIQPFFLLTWGSCFFCSWCEYPSTLVLGLLSTLLPLLLHPPQGTPQIKLHIYIDDINNISPPVWHTNTEGQCQTTEHRMVWTSKMAWILNIYIYKYK